MTQGERRLYLIQALLEEDPQYRNIIIPEEEQQQRDLLRALMNLRPPKRIAERFLEIQDQYLQQENWQAGQVEADKLPVIAAHPQLVIWRGDITKLQCDAIVNAANSAMLGCFQPLHNCIDNQIHSKSGVQLRLHCWQLMQRQGHEEPTGQAKLTPAFNLPSRYILHTVGPIVQGRVTQQHRQLLAGCYQSCLELAAQHQLETVAFCCISTGVFGFPQQPAAQIAVQTVTDFLQRQSSIRKVIFNVFQQTDEQLYRGILGPDSAAEASH